MRAADGGAEPPQPRLLAGPSQTSDNSNASSLKERASIIAASWRAATSPLGTSRLLQSLHRNTIWCILQPEWARLEESARDEVIKAIDGCFAALKSENQGSSDEKKLEYLLLTTRDAWHHPVLNDIMRGGQPEAHQVSSWLREEGCSGALERLRQLCAAGGKLEGAALRLALALAPPPPGPETLPPNFRCHALEALLVLLLRARRTTDCITNIKAMEVRDAVALVSRLATRNKSHGRIWRHALDTALLCTQVLVATYLVKPIEDGQLAVLAARLASLYATRSEELAPALRKLLHSADTAAHIYIVCRAVQHQFDESMRPFVCELYIRALTTGVNELERQKHQDESGSKTTQTSHQLADWFISLADLLSPNVMVSAECVLTAFSLHPSKLCYQRVKECSANINQKTEMVEPVDIKNENVIPESLPEPEMELSNDKDEFSLALIGLENDLNQLELAKKLKTEEFLNQKSPQSLVSSAVLEAEGLELSSDLCHDLAVLLSGPRLKMLTWDLSWDKLSEYCLSYMADTEEGTKSVTKELKYVHLDYSQYEIKEPEVHDIYFGIEKGYEHHLEVEDDEWDIDDTLNEDGRKMYNFTTDSDCKYDIDHKREPKKLKKKSSKKLPLHSDVDASHKMDKPKCVKKEKKPREKQSKNKSKHKKSKQNTSSTDTDSESDEVKSKFGFVENYSTDKMFNKNLPMLNNLSNIEFNQRNIVHNAVNSPSVPGTSRESYKPPLTSFFRKQMELYENHKKEVERSIFGENSSQLSTVDKHLCDASGTSQQWLAMKRATIRSTYHIPRKENAKRPSSGVNKNTGNFTQYSPNSSTSTQNYDVQSTPMDLNISNKSAPHAVSLSKQKSSLISFRKQNVKQHKSSELFIGTSHSIGNSSTQHSSFLNQNMNLTHKDSPILKQMISSKSIDLSKIYYQSYPKGSASNYNKNAYDIPQTLDLFKDIPVESNNPTDQYDLNRFSKQNTLEFEQSKECNSSQKIDSLDSTDGLENEAQNSLKISTLNELTLLRKKLSMMQSWDEVPNDRNSQTDLEKSNYDSKTSIQIKTTPFREIDFSKYSQSFESYKTNNECKEKQCEIDNNILTCAKNIERCPSNLTHNKNIDCESEIASLHSTDGLLENAQLKPREKYSSNVSQELLDLNSENKDIAQNSADLPNLDKSMKTHTYHINSKGFNLPIKTYSQGKGIFPKNSSSQIESSKIQKIGSDVDSKKVSNISLNCSSNITKDQVDVGNVTTAKLSNTSMEFKQLLNEKQDASLSLKSSSSSQNIHKDVYQRNPYQYPAVCLRKPISIFNLENDQTILKTLLFGDLKDDTKSNTSKSVKLQSSTGSHIIKNIQSPAKIDVAKKQLENICQIKNVKKISQKQRNVILEKGVIIKPLDAKSVKCQSIVKSGINNTLDSTSTVSCQPTSKQNTNQSVDSDPNLTLETGKCEEKSQLAEEETHFDNKTNTALVESESSIKIHNLPMNSKDITKSKISEYSDAIYEKFLAELQPSMNAESALPKVEAKVAIMEIQNTSKNLETLSDNSKINVVLSNSSQDFVNPKSISPIKGSKRTSVDNKVIKIVSPRKNVNKSISNSPSKTPKTQNVEPKRIVNSCIPIDTRLVQNCNNADLSKCEDLQTGKVKTGQNIHLIKINAENPQIFVPEKPTKIIKKLNVAADVVNSQKASTVSSNTHEQLNVISANITDPSSSKVSKKYDTQDKNVVLNEGKEKPVTDTKQNNKNRSVIKLNTSTSNSLNANVVSDTKILDNSETKYIKVVPQPKVLVQKKLNVAAENSKRNETPKCAANENESSSETNPVKKLPTSKIIANIHGKNKFILNREPYVVIKKMDNFYPSFKISSDLLNKVESAEMNDNHNPLKKTPICIKKKVEKFTPYPTNKEGIKTNIEKNHLLNLSNAKVVLRKELRIQIPKKSLNFIPSTTSKAKSNLEEIEAKCELPSEISDDKIVPCKKAETKNLNSESTVKSDGIESVDFPMILNESKEAKSDFKKPSIQTLDKESVSSITNCDVKSTKSRKQLSKKQNNNVTQTNSNEEVESTSALNSTSSSQEDATSNLSEIYENNVLYEKLDQLEDEISTFFIEKSKCVNLNATADKLVSEISNKKSDDQNKLQTSLPEKCIVSKQSLDTSIVKDSLPIPPLSIDQELKTQTILSTEKSEEINKNETCIESPVSTVTENEKSSQKILKSILAEKNYEENIISDSNNALLKNNSIIDDDVNLSKPTNDPIESFELIGLNSIEKSKVNAQHKSDLIGGHKESKNNKKQIIKRRTSKPKRDISLLRKSNLKMKKSLVKNVPKEKKSNTDKEFDPLECIEVVYKSNEKTLNKCKSIKKVNTEKPNRKIKKSVDKTPTTDSIASADITNDNEEIKNEEKNSSSADSIISIEDDDDVDDQSLASLFKTPSLRKSSKSKYIPSNKSMNPLISSKNLCENNKKTISNEKEKRITKEKTSSKSNEKCNNSDDVIISLDVSLDDDDDDVTPGKNGNNVNSDVIDLVSDSDSSDVEIVISNDPIAIDFQPMEEGIKEVVKPIKNTIKSTPVPPLFFKVVPEIKMKCNEIGRRKRYMKKGNLKTLQDKDSEPESLIIVNEDTSKIIKISKILPSDQEKLQKICVVKLKIENLKELKKKVTMKRVSKNLNSNSAKNTKKIVKKNQTKVTPLHLRSNNKNKISCRKTVDLSQCKLKLFPSVILNKICTKNFSGTINLKEDKSKIQMSKPEETKDDVKSNDNAKSNDVISNDDVKSNDDIKSNDVVISDDVVISNDVVISDDVVISNDDVKSVDDVKSNDDDDEFFISKIKEEVTEDNDFTNDPDILNSDFENFEANHNSNIDKTKPKDISKETNENNDQSKNDNCSLFITKINVSESNTIKQSEPFVPTNTTEKSDVLTTTANFIGDEKLNQSVELKVDQAQDLEKISVTYPNMLKDDALLPIMSSSDFEKSDIISNDNEIKNSKGKNSLKSSNDDMNEQNKFEKESSPLACAPKEAEFVRTYQNNYFHKTKRKLQFAYPNSKKKFRSNSSRIDLPKLSSKDIGLVSHKFSVDKKQLYDKSFALTIKQLLLQEIDEYKLENTSFSETTQRDLDVDSLDAFETEIDFVDFLSKRVSDLIENDENCRDSFYSPIFNECATDVCDENVYSSDHVNRLESSTESENATTVTNMDKYKHQRRGKGFGDWSGRRNTKDSSRGRQKGPAAVLSDTFTTRPPLALHNFASLKPKALISCNGAAKAKKIKIPTKKENFNNSRFQENEKNNNLVMKYDKGGSKACQYKYNDNFHGLDKIANEVKCLSNITNLFNKSISLKRPFKYAYKEPTFDSKKYHSLDKIVNDIKSLFNISKLFNKNLSVKRPLKFASKEPSFDNKMSISNRSDIFSNVPGLDTLDFISPPPTSAIIQVVQLGQLPVSSAQTNSLSSIAARPQTTSNEYLDLSTNNSVDFRSPSNEPSHQSSSIENNGSEFKENDVNESVKIHNTNEENEHESGDNGTSNDTSPKTSENEISFNNIQTSSKSESNDLKNETITNAGPTSEKTVTIDFQQSNSNANYSEDSAQNEQKESAIGENQINVVPTSTTNFVSTNRGQTLVNLISQKIIQTPGTGPHVQMAAFAKGATINALSLQQALAQILPPPLSQASGESVIHSAGHSTGTSQVVHIVQGKNTSHTSNTFGSLLVDNTQPSVMNTSGATQVLHIVQGKPTSNSNNSNVLNQSQISGTTFSGLSLVDTGSQQNSNQVLHIVNTGVQSKNNTTQVLKRVNLLTSITNQQGNNEQKMVQFVCKSADGKAIQLNTQPQRGMVLRLQPIDNSSFTAQKTSESQITASNTSVVQSNLKPQVDQSQELKSRSIYEENYAKFIQNSSNQIIPSSPEKSVTLPKFNQAFGKSVFQDNSTHKSTESLEQSQTPTATTSNEQQGSQDLTTLNLSQLGHISNPPLLIRKAPQSNIVHQNVVQQVKQSIGPMNIQTIHGGVIYTRQIPVNIGGGQTINLITVPSSDIIDEVQLQSIQKQTQEKSNANEQQLESQVIKLVPQDQQQTNSSVCNMDTSDDTNQSYTEQTQNNVSNHPLLTQMRIKVPMLSKGGNQMVAGTRVVRPVLQIQRNLIPGSNPAVYQQLVLTAAPALRQPTPTPVTTTRATRPPSTPHQESNLSSSTLEQLREFDMVLEQVKERSTVQPGSNSNSTFSDTSPQRQVVDNNNEVDSPQSNVGQPPAQREVLYSIGPNQTVNVTYVNQKVISKAPTVLTTTYTSSDSVANISSQNSPSNQISHNLTSSTHTKPCNSAPTKVNSKSIKTKPTKPTNPSTSTASKSSPVATKTSLQKPLEDEQTTQRILYILAEYKEQVENSPDKDKPAPRRRSNPPTNPTTSSKRKKGSSSSSKKGSSGQSLQEMSPLGGEDAGHTMGSEDSSCGLSQGECTDNSIQGPDNQSPQSSPQKSAKKILFQQDSEASSTPITQQQRNVIIADGQTIAMARPGAGKTTAVLMPANYLLPMSMVKGGQQITIVTNQGPKILSVPHGEGGTTNALFLQRLISPAGLKPMLARPGQVRHVRLPANAVQNLQAFNLNSSSTITSQETSWIGNNTIHNSQPKLLVEYSSNISSNAELNLDSIKTEIIDPQSIKEENMSESGELLTTIKIEDTGEGTNDASNLNRIDENMLMDTPQSSMHDTNIHTMSDHMLHQSSVVKSSTNNTLNLIQVHSLNADCRKLFSVQNSGNLVQLSGKSGLGRSHANLNDDAGDVSLDIHDSETLLMRKHAQFGSQFLNSNKLKLPHDSVCSDDSETKGNESNMETNLASAENLAPSPQQSFILTHSSQQNDSDSLTKSHREDNHAWSTNGGVTVSHGNETSSFVSYEDSPQRLIHREEQHDTDVQESDGARELSESGTRVLRHPYSPSASPPGPRHLYHKMFITNPIKKAYRSDLVEHSTSSADEDKQFIQQHLKKNSIDSASNQSVTLHNNNASFTIHHHVNIRHTDGKTSAIESVDVGSSSGTRGSLSQNASSAASLRHKFAVMEHELRLQKSLSEECEDLGVDSPSASDLFPEAELLFPASPSSQFDHSQDGCVLAPTNHVSPSTSHIASTIEQQISSGSISTNIRDSRLIENQIADGAEESEFARMHPNTTFHSGEIELVGDDADDTAVNISFRSSSSKQSHPHRPSKRGNIIRSVIEGIGNSGGNTSFPPSKLTPHFSMVDLPRRSMNVLSSVHSSDDYSGADDSMNSAESKEGLVNNKCLDGILSNDIVKRDLNLSSAESSICISSGIIQRNITQVIRHASSDQISLPNNEVSQKLCNSNISGLNQNGRSFLLEGSNDTRPVTDSNMLKSMMMERDGRDGLTCSSPEQHSELFWESNSNSNQSEEQIPQPPPNLLDFSSEDSNKCKSPLSCEETNSTDSSSIGEHNSQSHNSHHPNLRVNSVIKTPGSNSSAADGPILHSALLSSTPNVVTQDVPNKMPLKLNNVHKSDSNTTSSSPEDGNRTGSRRNWGRSLKGSGGRRILSPRSLSAEINMGAEIETSSSEGVSILTKPSGSGLMHSGSSTPEEGSSNSRRVSLRGPGGVKRSCHCCGGTPTTTAPASTSSTPRRIRRKPPPLH